jgi:glycosyltransferase involved in cell wall biosynthesis
MQAPLVSVIIPTWNREVFLLEAVRSVQAQTFADWELIVVDDGSTDGTRAEMEALAEPRLRYIYQQNRGESSARNHGAREARGEFFAFLDSDDLWAPRALECALGFFRCHPSTGLVTWAAREVDAEGRRTGRTRPKRSRGHFYSTRSLLGRDWGFVRTPMVRRHCFFETGGFDETMRHGEDMDFYLRFSLHCPLAQWPEPLYLWRRHGGNTLRMDQHRARLAILDKFEPLALARDPSLGRSLRAARAWCWRSLGRALLRSGAPPAEARAALVRAMRLAPWREASYRLWLASFFR